MRQRFATRKDAVTMRMVLLGYLLLAVCVGVPVLLTPSEDLEFTWAMLIPLGIALFMFYVLTASTMKFFASFVLDERGLLIHLPPFHRRTVPAGQIRELRVLDVEESRQLFDASIREQFAVQEQMDVARYLRLLRKKIPAFKYLSVAPSARLGLTGRMKRLAWLDVKNKERMVVLSLRDGTALYLSADDVDGFVEAARTAAFLQ